MFEALIQYEGVWIGVSSFLVMLITSYSKYRLLKKATLPARGAFIPLYREYLRFRLAGRPKWTWRLLCPPIAFILQLMANFYVAKKFQKSDFFAIGICILPVVFLPLLASTSVAKYSPKAEHSRSFMARLFIAVCALLLLCGSVLWYTSNNKGKFPMLDQANIHLEHFAHKVAGGILSNGMVLSDEEYHFQDQEALSREELQPFLAQLEKGDILFTASEKYTSSYVIPGLWKHTFLYLGSGEIIDASGTYGVAKRKLIDLNNLRRGSLLNGLLAYRPQLTTEQKSDFLSFIEQQIGKEYDFGFKGTDDTFYCSSLISEGLKNIGITIDYQTELFGIRAISPINMVDYIENKGLKNGEFTKIFLLEKSAHQDSETTKANEKSAREYCEAQKGKPLKRYMNAQAYVACILPDGKEVGAIELWREHQLNQ